MSTRTTAQLLAGACAITLIGAISTAMRAQGQAPAAQGQAPAAGARAGGAGGGARGGVGTDLFGLFDANKNNQVTRDEMRQTFDGWYAAADTSKSGSITTAQLATALTAALPAPEAPANAGAGAPGAGAPAGAAAGGAAGGARAGGGAAGAAAAGGQRGGGAGAGGGRGTPTAFVAGAVTPGLNDACGGRSQTPTVACQKDIDAMMAAIPATAPVKPTRAHKVLIFSRIPSSGYQHSSIPLAAKTIEEMGKKTGAWTSDTSWDPAVFTAANLKQYDAIFLSSTTGCFLDDATDPAGTLARRQAFVEFVRSGKGVAGIHATGDSYHGGGGNCVPEPAPAGAAPAAGAAAAGAGAARGGGGGGRGGGGAGAGGSLAGIILRWSWGVNDKKLQANDQTLTKTDMDAVSDAMYAQLDPGTAGQVSRADFDARITPLVTASNTYVGTAGRDNGRGSWADWNTMIGGFFKFHWLDPQQITVKVDDKNSPLTKMFNGADFDVNDETYTFSINSFSRENVHVLTSINYDKMSFMAKLKESNPRPDHDFGLSWIKKEGQGRVFYMALGHDERIYGMPNMMAHLMAGMDYVVGDLKADDSPSVKPGTAKK